LAKVKEFAKLFLIKFIGAKIGFFLKFMSSFSLKNYLLTKSEFNVTLHSFFRIFG